MTADLSPAERATVDRIEQAPDALAGCACPPCPGRGNDGHRMTHCAECCFGTGVDADLDCPVHGMDAYAAPDALGLREEVAEVLAAHRYRDVLGDYEVAPYYKHFGCTCGWEKNIAGMNGWRSWVAAHNAHLADALLPLIERREAEAAERALRDARAKVAALPTTRTQAWSTGWDSVALGDVLGVLGGAQ